VISEYLDPLVKGGIDTLVLGCTHYPLLRPTITQLLGDHITLVDSAQNCANAVRELLIRDKISAPKNKYWKTAGRIDGSTDRFLRIARNALNLDVGEVQLREIAVHVNL
jgi:glutamate racemase